MQRTTREKRREEDSRQIHRFGCTVYCSPEMNKDAKLLISKFPGILETYHGKAENLPLPLNTTGTIGYEEKRTLGATKRHTRHYSLGINHENGITSGSKVALLLFNLTNEETFNQCKAMARLLKKRASDTRIILLGIEKTPGKRTNYSFKSRADDFAWQGALSPSFPLLYADINMAAEVKAIHRFIICEGVYSDTYYYKSNLPKYTVCPNTTIKANVSDNDLNYNLKQLLNQFKTKHTYLTSYFPQQQLAILGLGESIVLINKCLKLPSKTTATEKIEQLSKLAIDLEKYQSEGNEDIDQLISATKKLLAQEILKLYKTSGKTAGNTATISPFLAELLKRHGEFKLRSKDIEARIKQLGEENRKGKPPINLQTELVQAVSGRTTMTPEEVKQHERQIKERKKPLSTTRPLSEIQATLRPTGSRTALQHGRSRGASSTTPHPGTQASLRSTGSRAAFFQDKRGRGAPSPATASNTDPKLATLLQKQYEQSAHAGRSNPRKGKEAKPSEENSNPSSNQFS